MDEIFFKLISGILIKLLSFTAVLYKLLNFTAGTFKETLFSVTVFASSPNFAMDEEKSAPSFYMLTVCA